MAFVDFDLISKIRQHINRIEKQSELMENRKKWLRLTAALDVLEDTSCAIRYYREAEYPKELDGKYLFTYGVLQALFVQEDAVNSINFALFDKNVEFEKNYPDAFAVREMRNDIIGHPTCRNNNQFIHLAQYSLSKKFFRYIKTEDKNNPFSIIDVDVEKAISDVASCVNTVLIATLERLEEEFREYIDKHRERKMKEIFHMLHYAKEKTLTSDYMGDWGYNATKDMVEKCEEELRLRYGNVEAVDSYKYLLEDIHEIYDLIDNGISQVPYKLQAGINKYLLKHLFVMLEELESYCEETDQYFENYGEESFEDCDSIELPSIINEGADELSD